MNKKKVLPSPKIREKIFTTGLHKINIQYCFPSVSFFLMPGVPID